MPSNPAVIAEFIKRKDAEREKALRKYGADALLPAGKPDYDVLDYTINELVGLIRYAQMNEARFKLMRDVMDELPRQTRDVLLEGIDFSRELEAFAAQASYDAIYLHQQLKKKGLHLGLTEKAA